MKLRRLARM
jgi:glycyl-tRNA synthetase (class II)